MPRTTMIRPIRAWKDVLREWAPELSLRLKRSQKRILAEGLTADDFSPDESVEVRHPNGRVKKFCFAFALVRPRRKMAAVFSEHDGYREFDLVSDAVVASICESIYRQR